MCPPGPLSFAPVSVTLPAVVRVSCPVSQLFSWEGRLTPHSRGEGRGADRGQPSISPLALSESGSVAVCPPASLPAGWGRPGLAPAGLQTPRQSLCPGTGARLLDAGQGRGLGVWLPGEGVLTFEGSVFCGLFLGPHARLAAAALGRCLLLALPRRDTFSLPVLHVTFRCFPGRKRRHPADATLFKPESFPSASCLPGIPRSLWSANFILLVSECSRGLILLQHASLLSFLGGLGDGRVRGARLLP